MSNIKFEQVVVGKAFRVKEWNSNGKKWQTFSFSYGKKNNEGGWTNTYLNITLFLKPEEFQRIDEGEMVKLSGKFEPNFYQKKDGTFVETLGFVSFEVIDRENNHKTQDLVDLDSLTDDDLMMNKKIDIDFSSNTNGDDDDPFA